MSDSPLFYQWIFQGTNLLNGTNSTLQLTNVTLSQAGTYRSLFATRVEAPTARQPY